MDVPEHDLRLSRHAHPLFGATLRGIAGHLRAMADGSAKAEKWSGVCVGCGPGWSSRNLWVPVRSAYFPMEEQWRCDRHDRRMDAEFLLSFRTGQSTAVRGSPDIWRLSVCVWATRHWRCGLPA